MTTKNLKILLIILIGGLLALMMAWSWKSFGGSGTEIDYNFFWKQLEADNIAELTFTGAQVVGKGASRFSKTCV